ncbi:MAG: hypothetical protein AABY84_12315 [Candidatus Firestonebacteria bacterium]
MTPRERVLTTLARQKPDKVPKEAGFSPALYEIFKQKTNSIEPNEYFNMETRYPFFKDTTRKIDFSKYYGQLPEGKEGKIVYEGEGKHTWQISGQPSK